MSETAPNPPAPPAAPADTTPKAPEISGSPPSTYTPPPEFIKGGKILGKYNSPEEVFKAYQEAEKKLGERARNPGDGTFARELADTDGVAAVLERAGLRFDDVAQRFTQTGSLEDADYAALKKQGFTRTMVDEYLAGQKVIAETQAQTTRQIVDGATQYVGGKEQLDTLLAFGRELPKHVQDTINGLLKSPDTYRDGLDMLKSRYTQKVGTPGTQVSGMPSSSSGVGFATQAELASAMKEIRSKGGQPFDDPAFKARLNATPKHILGILS